jgi:large subunit ribosomal protein L29
MSIDELLVKKNELEEEIFNLRIQSKIKQVTNPKKITLLRHDIAKINTLIHENATGIRPLNS